MEYFGGMCVIARMRTTKAALTAIISSVLALSPVVARAAEAPEKVGYIDMQQALHMTNQGKREEERLRKESEDKQKKLDVAQNELKALKDDFDKQAAMLTEAARNKKTQEMQTKYGQLQEMHAKMQKELAERSDTVTKEMVAKLRAITEKIGDRDGYTVILERSANNVMYYKRNMDITDEVISTYNTQNK